MNSANDGTKALTAKPSALPNTMNWQSSLAVLPERVPPPSHAWLFDEGSLTRKLVALSNDQFSVQVLRQDVATPDATEAKALKIAQQTPVMIREVVLNGRGCPWVFARSILPMTTMTGRLVGLRTLSNQPLGELLFQDPSMTREPLEAAYLSARVLCVPAALTAGDQLLWARRSVFFLDQKPLLVSEVFLSEFKLEA